MQKISPSHQSQNIADEEEPVLEPSREGSTSSTTNQSNCSVISANSLAAQCREVLQNTIYSNNLPALPSPISENQNNSELIKPIPTSETTKTESSYQEALKKIEVLETEKEELQKINLTLSRTIHQLKQIVHTLLKQGNNS